MNVFELENSFRQLADLIKKHAPTPGTFQTLIPALNLMHAITPSQPVESLYKPSICVVAQGKKTSLLSNEAYCYDVANYLVTSMDLPIRSTVTTATPSRPYLGLKLNFEIDIIIEAFKHIHTSNKPSPDKRGIALSPTSPKLLDPLLRLISLLDTPQDISFMAPLIIREILYRVIQDNQNVLIHQLAIIGSHTQKISQAIKWLTQHYNQAISMEELAQSVNMSNSLFYKQFKLLTTMSPLQFQKTIRLQEARRLMLVEKLQAADAAFRVGYESPSQFSREYARQYGKPPAYDISEQLKKVQEDRSN